MVLDEKSASYIHRIMAFTKKADHRLFQKHESSIGSPVWD